MGGGGGVAHAVFNGYREKRGGLKMGLDSIHRGERKPRPVLRRRVAQTLRFWGGKT